MSGLRMRWLRLGEILRAEKGVLIAFSGGCDSTLALHAAVHFLGRDRVIAVTAASASLAAEDRARAVRLAEMTGAAHRVVATDEMANPDYVANPSNRCFFCKDELFQKLFPIAAEKQWTVMDGFNLSDCDDYRPGTLAAKKWSVRHPLLEASLAKRDVRALSRWQRLPTWNIPASPCLSSRIPYGTAVTPRALRQIENAESMLRAKGFSIVRVRHFGDDAKIEVPKNKISDLAEELRQGNVISQFRALGFERIIIDSEGFRSGKLNDALKNRAATLS